MTERWISGPRERDAALQKLRDWRLSIALGGAGAVVAFSTVAAFTIPGKHKASTPTTSSSSSNTGSTSNGDSSAQSTPDAGSGSGDSTLQAPQQQPSIGSGGGQAVSGGS